MRMQIFTALMAAAMAAVVAAPTVPRGVAAEAAETRVFSSATPRGILLEIAPEFERATGQKLAIESAFAADLGRLIEASNPFDVAILPPDIADDLVRQGKLVAGARVDLGRTGLGVAVRAGARKPDIGTSEALRVALLAAPTVAYAEGGASGVQFHSILRRLGIAEAMQPKLRPYPTGGAVEAVARGEADMVVIGISPILSEPAVTLAGWLPAEVQSYIAFTANIGTGARRPEAAQTLLRLLTSPAAIAFAKSQGFEPSPP